MTSKGEAADVPVDAIPDDVRKFIKDTIKAPNWDNMERWVKAFAAQCVMSDRTARSATPAEVRVKPLEWRACPPPTADIHIAETPFGEYRTWGYGQHFLWSFNNGLTNGYYTSLDEAKAAAQGDLQKRWAALSQPPEPNK